MKLDLGGARSIPPNNCLPDLLASLLLREPQFVNFFPVFLSNLAERLGEAGMFADGLVTIKEAFDSAEARNEEWGLAEFARIKGRLLFMAGMAAEAEFELMQAVELARRQGGLFWELRAARNLAELRHAQGRTAEGCELLSAVCARFTEGFQSADFLAARKFLDDLAA